MWRAGWLLGAKLRRVSVGAKRTLRRRTKVAIVIVIVLAAAGIYAGNRLATGGEVTEVGVDEALDRFREQAGAAATSTSVAATVGDSTAAPTSTVATSTAALPELGVYQYTTTGFDRIDALTGAQHDYPAITTMTVTPFGCGVRVRWDIAVERWDSWDWCLAGDAIDQTGWVGYHEFFNTPGRNDYACDGDPRPLAAPAGTTWAMTCRMGERTSSIFSGEVVDRTSLMVGGVSVPVLHLRYAVEVVGESTGHQTVEGWYRITDGLPVREQLTTTTAQETVIGVANFDEQYTIDLLTLTPAA
jgi:hypothetical protein